MSWLRKHLFSLGTGFSSTKIRQTLHPLLHPDHKYSLAHTDKIRNQIREDNIKLSTIDLLAMPALCPDGGVDIKDTMATLKVSELSCASLQQATDDLSDMANGRDSLLDWKMRQAYFNDLDMKMYRASYAGDDTSKRPAEYSYDDLKNLDFLLPNAGEADDRRLESNESATRILHAPLVDAGIIFGDGVGLAQYGLLGTHDEVENSKSKLLLNTNVPFSIFLCGVQGSGKSHTTSCILENSLIPSRHLGRLLNPLSAMVFHYAQFSGEGLGFTVSEAAFLASPDPRLPGGAHVRKVHVLVSPSNFIRISKLYLRLPNVLVTPFKLKPRDLDIDTMLTLMNISESDETPLYMAQVTQILREMSTAGRPFDYNVFKLQLKKKDFNSTQTSMLQMRLDLLESFLDMDARIVAPQFEPGEITIMDMSCPFVDANTACILFRIGLKQYLQSKTTGKMIVLDEAHKYMLNVPGAKALNETLVQIIRLQRHYGARVVISTQEPTLLTDLIALCSVTVIHRFSSPEWLSAVKRHIPTTAEEHDDLMLRIESLTTGQAILYSPTAVFERGVGGDLVTGTSKLFNVSIRKRLTSDGGQSVLAV